MSAPVTEKVVATAQVPSNGLAKAPIDVGIRFTELFIGGKFVPSKSGKVFPVVNPRTGKKICDVSEADKEDVDEAVRAARAAFTGPWSTLGPSGRAHLMLKLADIIEANADELAALESADNGKTFGIARHVDIPLVVNCVRYFAGWCGKNNGQTIELDGDLKGETVHEPVGVCAGIIPWNFPSLMLVWKLSPALACGNTVIIKTSEKTPLSGLRIASFIREAGFPPGVVNIISGFGPTAGQPLAAHSDIDKVAFTGSTAVGRKILHAVADSNLKKVSLELGGKSPTIVLPDVNLDAAVETVMSAFTFNAGQVCCAGTRTFVHESIYDKFVQKLGQHISSMKSLDEHDHMMSAQPIVDEIQYKRVNSFLESGQKEGARLVAGGKSDPRDGYFVKPTVFADVEDHHTIAREEIFGPVGSIFKYKDLDEAIQRANNTQYGLAASVLTNDINVANYVVARLKAGTVWVNTHNQLQAGIPFGGFKTSGIGRDLGAYALHEYSEVKSVITKVAMKAPDLSKLHISA